MRLNNKILSKYREIKYLNDTTNTFDLQTYLNKRGIYLNEDIDAETFISVIDKASNELSNYPISRAKEMSIIIKKNYLDSETMKLEDIAKELCLTYPNAYRIRAKAINIMQTLTA